MWWFGPWELWGKWEERFWLVDIVVLPYGVANPFTSFFIGSLCGLAESIIVAS
jgi:hypothetical protein